MLAPPPEAPKPPPLAILNGVSFQASSGIYSRAEEIESEPAFDAPQYGGSPAAVFPVTTPALSPKNSLPPAPVVSGIAAGESTAKPCVADVLLLGSQSAAPASPDAETSVTPSNCPSCSHCSTTPTLRV